MTLVRIGACRAPSRHCHRPARSLPQQHAGGGAGACQRTRMQLGSAKLQRELTKLKAHLDHCEGEEGVPPVEPELVDRGAPDRGHQIATIVRFRRPRAGQPPPTPPHFAATLPQA